jgi:PhnB protein
MPQFEPYLTFAGNCAEAMRTYEKILGGKLTLMKMGDSPMAAPNAPPEARERIMHARLELDGRSLMASDTMPDMTYDGMHGVSISLAFADVAQAKKVFDALADGGKVIMPLQKTFWVESFGMLVDRFGTHWMVNGGTPAAM